MLETLDDRLLRRHRHATYGIDLPGEQLRCQTPFRSGGLSLGRLVDVTQSSQYAAVPAGERIVFATLMGLLLAPSGLVRAQLQDQAYRQVPVMERPQEVPRVDAVFGEGATLRSDDGLFTLNIRGRIQARATLRESTERDEPPVTEMLIRRLRLVFQGHALGPTLTYYIQLAFSNLDMEPDLRSPLRDAYFTWAIGRDANLRVGQQKVPYNRQRVISSSALQMVDRSLVVAELNLDRDVGLHLFTKDLFGLGGRLGYSLGLFHGNGRNRLATEHGLLYAARLELTPLGPFNDYMEADIPREPHPKLALGASAAYNQNTNRPRSTFELPYADARFDYRHMEADVLFKWRGFSATAEWMLRQADRDAAEGQVDGMPVVFLSRSAWGAFVQAGQMLIGGLELSARYGYLTPLDGAEEAVAEHHEMGGAVSYYWRAHNLKLQTDYFYVTGASGWTDTGTRVLLPGQPLPGHQLRVQSQLFF